MRIFILFLFTTLFFIPAFLFAQTYYPFPTQNAIWNCSYSEGWELGNNHGYDSWEETYFTTGDTTINSTVYTQLYKAYLETHATYYGSGGPPTINYGGSSAYYFGAIRNDSLLQKVFIYPANGYSEKIMYDFTIQVGDTIKNYFDDTINGWWNLRWFWMIDPIVESIDSILIDTSYRRRINFVNLWVPVSLIEGIGQTSGLFNSLNTMDHTSGQMACVSINSQPIYPDTNYACIALNTAETNAVLEISVFPNPAQSYIKISPIEIKSIYRIFDRCGSLIQSGEIDSNENSIPVSDLKNGLFLIQIFSEDKSVLHKFVVQH